MSTLAPALPPHGDDQARRAPILRIPPLRADGLTIDHPRRPPLAPRRWFNNLFVRVLAFAVVFVVLAALLGSVAGLALASTGRTLDPLETPLSETVLSGVLIVASVAAYLIVGRVLEQRSVVELSGRRVGGLLVGLALGFVFISVVVGVVWALGGLVFLGTQQVTGWLLILVTAGFQAGIVEEVLFRGVLFRSLEELFGTWASALVSAALFGAVHLGNPNATWLGALSIAVTAGLLFAGLYALTRNLWVVIGVHFAWNVTMALVYDVPVSGVDVHGWLHTEAAGSELISGGAFGVEASLVTLVLLGSLGVWLLIRVQRRGIAVAPFWVRRRRLAAAQRQPGVG